MILYDVDHTYRRTVRLLCYLQWLYVRTRSYNMTCIQLTVTWSSCRAAPSKTRICTPYYPGKRLGENVKELPVQRTVVHEHTTSCIDISYAKFSRATARTTRRRPIMEIHVFKIFLPHLSATHANLQTPNHPPDALKKALSKTVHKTNKLSESGLPKRTSTRRACWSVVCCWSRQGSNKRMNRPVELCDILKQTKIRCRLENLFW